MYDALVGGAGVVVVRVPSANVSRAREELGETYPIGGVRARPLLSLRFRSAGAATDIEEKIRESRMLWEQDTIRDIVGRLTGQ